MRFTATRKWPIPMILPLGRKELVKTSWKKGGCHVSSETFQVAYRTSGEFGINLNKYQMRFSNPAADFPRAGTVF